MQSSALKNHSVLYIGNDNQCDAECSKLIAEGCKTFHTAQTAGEALEQFKLQRPDIVLTDINLSDMDGLLLAKRLKTLAPKLPLIILTSVNQPERIIDAIRIGIHDYFLKPIEPLQILKRLEEVAKALSLKQENRKNKRLLDEYKKVVDISSVVTKTDPKGFITFANEKFLNITGYSREELIGHSHRIIRHPDTPKETFEELWSTIQAKKVWQGTITNRKKDGSSYIVNATIIPILDEHDEIVEYIAIRQDVTKLIEQERIIKRQTTDSLTQLPNREKLLEDLKVAKYPNLALINIDNFRDINDLYGLEVGDFVLKELSRVISANMQSSQCILYKLPSDEFAIMIDTAGDIYGYQERIKALIEHVDHHNFIVDDNHIHVSVTVGIAHAGSNILASADIAMQDARKLNKMLMVYDESRRSKEHTQQNLYWNREIKSAIANGRIVPYYQPICKSVDGVVEKYEALVRLIDRDGETISPFFFLDIAKKYRLYENITRTMITQTFEYFKEKPYEFSLNLSIEDIIDEMMVEFIKSQVSTFPQPERIVFEITESEGIENYNDVQLFLRDIKALGCKIAIDDFGTGYSNFEYILKLDIDYLKIDGSLIKNLPYDKDARVVVETILSFAKKLGIQTITEFVNAKECYALVKAMGADYMQGYYIGEPKPEADVICCNSHNDNACMDSYII